MHDPNSLIPSWQALLQVCFLETKRQWKNYTFVAFIVCTLMVLFVESGQYYLRKWQHQATGVAFSSLESNVHQTNGRWSATRADADLALKDLRIHVQAQSQTVRAQAEKALEKEGAIIPSQQDRKDQDIVLSLVNSNGEARWEIQSGEVGTLMEHRKNIQVVLNNHASEVREELTKDLPVDAREQRVYLNQETGRALRTQLESRVSSILIYIPLVLVVYFLMMLSGSIAGIEWDTRRAQGSLEAWALTPHGPWTLYGGEILARAAWSSTIVLCVSGILYAYEALSIPLVISLWVVSFGGVCFISMWGMLATMLFRHRYGRMFGRIFLSPATFAVITLIRLTLITGFASVLASNEAYKLGQHVSPHALAIALFASGVALVCVAIALVPLVEWRIGARRIGLRKL